MTDGILLAEIQRRPRPAAATTRSSSTRPTSAASTSTSSSATSSSCCPRRPDLKVIITSATIDTERFAEHFGDGAAPIVEVSGRTYPVEVRYRPRRRPTDARGRRRPRPGRRPSSTPIAELDARGPGRHPRLPLRRARDPRHRRRAARTGLPDTEILPLYARLSAAEQHRVFQPRIAAARRVVLATNVAETSLTVPGIRYVVDPGIARITRYSVRTKVQRLPDRADLAGQRQPAQGPLRPRRRRRLHPALLTRRTSSRGPRSPIPRSSAPTSPSVILPDGRARLGDVAAFPFLDPPDPRAITDGVPAARGARRASRDGDTAHRRSASSWPAAGRPAARPHDPRGRRGRAAPARCSSSPPRCPSRTRASARRQPAGGRRGAPPVRRARVGLRSPSSRSGTTWPSEQRELTGSAFRRLCRSEFLNYLRVREWQDLHGQLPVARPRARDQCQILQHRNGPWFTPPCSRVCSPTSA